MKREGRGNRWLLAHHTLSCFDLGKKKTEDRERSTGKRVKNDDEKERGPPLPAKRGSLQYGIRVVYLSLYGICCSFLNCFIDYHKMALCCRRQSGQTRDFFYTFA